MGVRLIGGETGYSLPRMTREKSLFDTHDPAAEAAADARAEADVAAGRVISHAAVRRWLGSWGKAKPQARPQIGD